MTAERRHTPCAGLERRRKGGERRFRAQVSPRRIGEQGGASGAAGGAGAVEEDDAQVVAGQIEKGSSDFLVESGAAGAPRGVFDWQDRWSSVLSLHLLQLNSNPPTEPLEAEKRS
jgi:hypothetical protein